MRFFDLHCDTLYRAVREEKNIYENDFHVSVQRSRNFEAYMGCYAVWIDDDLRGEKAFDFFKKCAGVLERQEKIYSDFFKICRSASDLETLKNGGKRGVILTVEGSSALGGDLSNLEYMKNSGVKIMTLTWNGSCEAGDGVGVLNSRGITYFGKKLLRELENHGIIVDISHASEKLFYDVLEISERPFVATHSNSKAVCNHRRNLSDEQIKAVKCRGGLIGLTFCKEFLSGSKDAGFDDILRHAEHFLSLSCEDNLSIGSDFDGAEVPDKICGIEKIEGLYEYFLRKNYKESLLEKIFFDNAYNFIKASY